MPVNAPYFNSRHLSIRDRYIAWIDVMGSRTMMTRSLATAANFIFKLHDAALSSPHEGLTLYPMNDGVFAAGDKILLIKDWLAGTFERVSLADMQVGDDWRKVFLTRAAVAYGPVAEGRNLGEPASPTLQANPDIRDAILVGAPVVNAFLHERHTGPFGIYVHESARTFNPPTEQPWYNGSFMRYWSKDSKPQWVTDTETLIDQYLAFCRKHTNELEYHVDSINLHEALAHEFFDF